MPSLAQPDSYTWGGRESGKVLYIELSQRLVWGATNQIAFLWHYVVCGGVSAGSERDTIAHACLFSVHNRIRHRKLRNAVALVTFTSSYYDCLAITKRAGTTDTGKIILATWFCLTV